MKVLIVEDDPFHVRLHQARLDASPTTRFQAGHAGSLEHALDHLANEPIDVVLLDLELPDASGVTAVRAIRHAHPDLPIVVSTGTLDDQTYQLAREAGADDITRKGADSDEQMELRLLAASYRRAFSRINHVETMPASPRAAMTDMTLHLRAAEQVVRELRSALAGGTQIDADFLDRELQRIQEALAPMRMPSEDLLLRPVSLGPLLREASDHLVQLLVPGAPMRIVAQEPSLRRALAALMPLMHAADDPIPVAWLAEKDLTLRIRILFSGAQQAKRQHPLLWTLVTDLLAMSMATCVADEDGFELRFPAASNPPEASGKMPSP